MFCERFYYNWVLDIFDILNLLKFFWNVFLCKDVSFYSVREYIFFLIYIVFRVVYLFCLFFGFVFLKENILL